MNGRVFLLARHAGLLDAEALPCPLTPGVWTEDVDLTLRRGARIVGTTVDDRTGAPIAGAMLSVRWTGTETRGARELSVRSDSVGAYSFSGLPEGEISLVARAQGHASSITSLELQPTGTTHLTTRLAPEEVLRGQVIDDAGQGVAGLHVEAGPPDALDRRVGSATETGADGGFRLRGLGVGSVRIVVSQGEVVLARTTTSLPSSAPMRISIRPPVILSGIVRAAPGDAPPEAVRVTLRALDPGSDLRLTGTGSGTRFELTHVPPGLYELSVRTRDGRRGRIARLEVSRAAAASPVQVSLAAAASLQGRVVQALDGSPVPYAEVNASASSPDEEGRLSSWTVRADEEGRFHIGGLSPDSYELSAKRTGFGSSPPMDPLLLQEREAVDVGDIPLSAPSRLQGQVIGPDGLPLAGASVQPTWYSELGDGEAVLPAVRTGEDGSFAIEDLREGSIRLTVAGFEERNFGVTLAPGELGSLVLDLSQPGPILEGTLRDASGEPVAGAVLWLDEVHNMASTRSEPTDADGHFRLPNVFEGDWDVRMDLPEGTGVGSQWVHLAPARGSVLSLTVPTGGLAGIVEAHEDGPFLVCLASEDAPASTPRGRWARWHYDAVTTGSDGSFRFAHLPPGRYRCFAAPRATASALRSRALWEDAVSRGVATTSGPLDVHDSVLQGLRLGAP